MAEKYKKEWREHMDEITDSRLNKGRLKNTDLEEDEILVDLRGDGLNCGYTGLILGSTE